MVKTLVKNVVGYARISSESQKDNTSISEQIKRIQAYCISQNWNLVKVFTDEAKSGSSTDERVNYNAMLEFAKEQTNEINAILVYKSDRVHRHLKNLLIMIEDDLEPLNVAFISVSENFDTSTPHGMLTLQMLGSFAEFEKNIINERTHTGRVITAKQGKYAGGKIPYGYILDGDKFIVSEVEAQNIVQIFKMYSEGSSFNRIANYLNNKQKHSKNDSGISEYCLNNIKQWSRTSISYILNNLAYTGLYIYNGKKEKNDIQVNMMVPPLISKKLFSKVQEIKKKNLKNSKVKN